VGFEAAEIARMPGAFSWLAHAGHAKPPTPYDEFFTVHDLATGNSVRCFSYGIQTDSGEHHAALCDDGTTAKVYAQEPEPLALTYLVQTRLGIRP
jgi:hypothetical protein